MERISIASFWASVKFLSFLFAVISVVNFFGKGFAIGLTGTISLLITPYRSAIQFVLGWLDPYLGPIVQHLAEKLKVGIKLYPHWKDIIVPVWLYFVANFKTNLGMSRELTDWPRKRNRIIFTAVLFFWGLIISLTVAIAAGSQILENTNMLVLAFTVSGFLIYELGSNFFWRQ